MIELLQWFQITYPELKRSLLECNHNFDDSDTNPYHVEGDCWSHTMMVCKIAELHGYGRVVQVAALLHDIGKPPSRNINMENNHVQFFGHEALSAKMAEPLVANLVQLEMLSINEAVEVIDLIELHAYLYKENDVEKIVEKFKSNVQLFNYLVELNICDDLGRFSKTMGTSTLDTDAILKRLST